MVVDENIRQIVRVKGTDLNGLDTIENAIRKVKGVGHAISRAVMIKLHLPKTKKVGELTDAELHKIEDVLDNPQNYTIPSFIVNRQHDMETGKSLHITGIELDMTRRGDIALMKTIKSYKGVRHSHGLKVRGQRTKSTGRKGSVAGVKKKK
ncbi:30S ribosomal protein S13 [archaeon CG10_big_fil_rev_8_21_14_0_10_43_11]|nr:MAG: 30S ribosomal protein S13 [archaeon CG10_big_fil_rev_8_21_14_0_10_43_11]